MVVENQRDVILEHDVKQFLGIFSIESQYLIIKLISAIHIQIHINCKTTLNKNEKDDNKNEVNKIIAK
jgi:hypothetical protein